MPGLLSQGAARAIGSTAAAAIAWRFKGELRITAIVKASFGFADDAAMARIEPQAIVAEEVPFGGGAGWSVQFTSDLVPYRRRADVLFTGCAHAPPGGPVEAMMVRLGVFEGESPRLDKALLIQKQGGFQRMPLAPAHGLGALGVEARSPLLGSSSCPSFGRHVVEIPDDFNWDFFQAAPIDQRVDFLRGGEWILLEGLHATLPGVRMRLPGARGLARIFGLSDAGVAEGAPLAMVADTLHVCGDEQRCVVTWRGTFPVSSEAALAAVRILMGVEQAGAPIAWPAWTELLAAPADVGTLESAPQGAPQSPVLPFGPARTAATVALPGMAPTERPAQWHAPSGDTLAMPPGDAEVIPASLPFRYAGAPSSMRARPVAAAGDPSASDALRALTPAAPVGAPAPPPLAAPLPARPAAPPRASPWAEPPPAAPAPPPAPPAKRAPPKVNFRKKLYGSDRNDR